MITLLSRREDGTFVAEINGMPYHVTEDDPLWGAAVSEAQRMGETLGFEPPPPAPEVPPPPRLTRRQLRLGLLAAGITTAQVETVIAAIPDEIDRETAQIEWADASQYERTHPLVDRIGASMSLTPEQIDAMWLAAAAF